MFHDISKPVSERMKFLEQLAVQIKIDNPEQRTPLWQIPPETGKLLALLAATVPTGRMVEIGTSGGYSGLWLSLAARLTGNRLTTFDIHDEKITLATETFESAGVTDLVELVEGDVRDDLDQLGEISFCFLDAAKEIYLDCYEAVVPRMVSGGILVADNMATHADALTGFKSHALDDSRVDALIDATGSGLLVARKL